MKRISSLTGVVLACVITNLSMQNVVAADESGVPDYRPFTLGMEAASTGPGLAASWRFTDHFGARAGVNGFLGLFSDEGLDVGTHEIEGNDYDVALNPLMSEQFALDIFPWKKSSFRITVGLMINQNELTGTGVPDSNGEFDINGVFYQSANGIGDLNLKMEQSPVAPFVSIGMNFYLDKNKHWSLGGELGVAYTGDPDVTLGTSSGAESGDPSLQANLNAEAQQIEDAAWKFYPIVKVSVNYSF